MAGRQKLVKKQVQKQEFRLPINYTEPDAPYFLPTQSAFIHDWTIRFRLFGGGLGNGKTTGGVALAYLLSIAFPGNMGYIGRWDGKELVQTTMTEFFKLIPDYMYDVNKQMGHIKFHKKYGGSEIFYGDLKKEEWATSLNLGWFWIDQAEEIDEARWNHGVSRLRRMTFLYGDDGKPLTDDAGQHLVAPTYGFATFNPEGTDHFTYRFAHPDSPEKKPDYKLYHASTFDGLKAGFVRQEYVDGMLSVFSEQARKRYLNGEWGVFTGRVFPNFEPSTHAITPIPLSPTWSYYVSIDHGLTNPTSVGVWAVLPNGIKIRVREHYEGNGKPVSYHAACIKNLISDLPSPPKLMVADPACWASTQSRDGHVFSIIDEYNEHKIYPVPGQNDWQAGYNRMNEALTVDPALLHPVTGHSGSPRLLCFNTCQHFIREMQNYKWKKARGAVLRNAPDEPIDYNDHTIDETRYLLSLLPSSPLPVPTVKELTALEKVHQAMATYNPLTITPKHGADGWMTV